MIATLRHLVSRFFEGLRDKRPGPDDQAWVSARLGPGAQRLFFAQPPIDQAHAMRVGRRVSSAAPERDDLTRAALLHDVGKRHARLGVVGRSLATALAAMHLPRTARMRAYLAHGEVGAGELAGAGMDEVTIEFARHHHGLRPEAIAEADWVLLSAADDE